MKLFLHMPKSAGTTLVRVFEKVYGNDSVYRNPDHYSNNRALAAAFLAMSDEERSRIEILCGHFPVGFHGLIPVDSEYITVLRDPIDRIISLYYFWRAHPTIDRLGFTRKYNSLADFIRSGVTKDVDNGMTRVIAGYVPGEESPAPYGGCSQALLDQAKGNLSERFAFVGVTERLPESLILLKRMFGWHHVPMFENLNATHNRPAKEDVDEPDMDALLEYTQLDRELYRYAVERLDELVSRQDDYFASEADMLAADLRDCQELCRNHVNLINEITSTRLWRWSRPVVRVLQPAMRLARRDGW
jgi:hypothetical protein